jgi:hypothetical protein
MASAAERSRPARQHGSSHMNSSMQYGRLCADQNVDALAHGKLSRHGASMGVTSPRYQHALPFESWELVLVDGDPALSYQAHLTDDYHCKQQVL